MNDTRGRPALPDNMKRVRLAGGPTVTPFTHKQISRISHTHDLSLGEVLDFLVWKEAHPHGTVNGWKQSESIGGKLYGNQ